jgi:type VI secretion system protein ImpA
VGPVSPLAARSTLNGGRLVGAATDIRRFSMPLDLAALLAPVSDDAPSGEAVEYDPQFNELETAARGTPEREVGSTIIPGEEPDWREVERIALELCGRAKDIRVAIFLLRAELRLAGLTGLAESLQLIKGYLADFWPSVHPQLDPEDDNDPSGRINALAALCDNELVLPVVRTLPLTQSRQFGRFSYRDYAIAAGLMQSSAKAQDKDAPKLPDAAAIDAGFADTELEVLQERAGAADAALEALAGIDAAIADALGAGGGPELDPLRRLLRDIKGLLDQQLAKRGGEAGAAAEDGGSAEAGTVEGAPVSARAPAGVIRGRGDVVELLDKICRYYADNEPSSPVPLLLERAKRLVTMNFLELLKDLTPDGVPAFGMIAGIREDQE